MVKVAPPPFHHYPPSVSRLPQPSISGNVAGVPPLPSINQNSNLDTFPVVAAPINPPPPAPPLGSTNAISIFPFRLRSLTRERRCPIDESSATLVADHGGPHGASVFASCRSHDGRSRLEHGVRGALCWEILSTASEALSWEIHSKA
jgi:hypothetical protein